MRLGATPEYTSDPFGANLGFDYAATQNRIPAGDRGAAANTRINADLSYRLKAVPASLLWYARLDNLTNKLAYSPISVLTTTDFPTAPPLPGRSLEVGMQASF